MGVLDTVIASEGGRPREIDDVDIVGLQNPQEVVVDFREHLLGQNGVVSKLSTGPSIVVLGDLS